MASPARRNMPIIDAIHLVERQGVIGKGNAKANRHGRKTKGRCPKGHGYCRDADCGKAARRAARIDLAKEYV